MNIIWKFILTLDGDWTLPMPADARILTVQLQSGQIALWAIVSPKAPQTLRHFLIAGTGHPVNLTDAIYIGTVQQDSFDWHVFETQR